MPAPAISVVLPAYNCSRFIRQTIESLLQQTCSNFELIVVDDGSTDDTLEVIRSFADERIKVFVNEKNQGLIYTLNRAIGLATGTYIARMDADDIALPSRLAVQKQWLDEHGQTAVVACTVTFIDDAGNQTGVWQKDRETISPQAIKQTMPVENCIAHPTVMMRSEVALRYPYNFSQVHSEDYDLWLRMLADGLGIDKIAEPLLLYRVHPSSITGGILRKRNPFYQQYQCKKTFLRDRIAQGKWGMFETKVMMAMFYDGIMGTAKQVKGKVKN